MTHSRWKSGFFFFRTLAYVQRCIQSLCEKTLGQSHHRRYIFVFYLGHIYVSLACSIVVEKDVWLCIFHTYFLFLRCMLCHAYGAVLISLRIFSLLPVGFDKNPFVQRVYIYSKMISLLYLLTLLIFKFCILSISHLMSIWSWWS